ncbi:hypothetical protein AGMMS49921_03980 [Endomicrobiia bacterium]|nr:hypothetical protein AGMMS49921_03980 [Endomicrobiia bacterium]
MSKIDELINKYCSNGVEFKTLEKVVISVKTGLNPRKNFQLNTQDAKNYYVTVKEVTSGKIVFSDRTDKINDEAISIISNRSNLEFDNVLFLALAQSENCDCRYSCKQLER